MTRQRLNVLDLDPGSDRPLYQQLFDLIVTRIQSGAFPAQHRLPPSRELAQELKIHRNTVVRAYEELEAAGFVESTVGRGTFVAALQPSGKILGAEPVGAPAMAWRSLASRAALAEPLLRMSRPPPVPAPDAIQLARMQPSPDLLPHELLHRCLDHVLRTLGPKSLSYAPPEGLPRLRALIAEELAKDGIPTRADELIITTGSQQALDVLGRTLVNPGDPVLIDPSTYNGAINLFSALGARLLSVDIDEDGPELSSLSRFERSGAKAYYLMPNGHNPTGRVISQRRRQALVEWSLRWGVPLIEDDYGEGLRLDDEPMPPALRAYSPEVVYLGTFSKKLIPALRIGFIVCPAALRPLLVPLKHAMDLGTSALLQHALAEFLERGYLRAHVHKVAPEYRRRRDALEAALRRHLPDEITWTTPRHGVTLWLRLPATIDPLRLYEEAPRCGVMIAPPYANTADGQAPPGVRLTFCAEPVDRLVEGARRLGTAVQAVLGTARPDRILAPVGV